MSKFLEFPDGETSKFVDIEKIDWWGPVKYDDTVDTKGKAVIGPWKIRIQLNTPCYLDLDCTMQQVSDLMGVDYKPKAAKAANRNKR